MPRPHVLLCDLDGVVWLAHEPIAGSVEAVTTAREAGMRVVFVTNNSRSTRTEQESALSRIGIDAEGDVLTSAMATARLVQPGWRVMVSGGPGLVEEVQGRGAEAITAYSNDAREGHFDAVVVGMHFEFDYEGMKLASTAVRDGAMFIASNTDSTYPTPTGEIPGGGAIVAAIATASGVEPIIAGKPHRTMADAVREMTGHSVGRDFMMVGDRPETDGAFAESMRCPFALVLSGVTARAEGTDADLVCRDLLEVVQTIIN